MRGAARGVRRAAVVLAWTLCACSGGDERADGVASASAGAGGSAVGVSGAGDGSGAGGRSGAGSGSAAATQLQACAAYIRGYCEVQARCQSGAFHEAGRESARQGCFARYAVHCPDALFSAGSVRTIEDALACAAAWPTISCSAYDRDASPACAIPGLLAADAPCLFGTQCASGSCTEFGNACGVCNALARAGEACGIQKCERGTYCMEGICVDAPDEDDVPASASFPELGQACDPSIGCGGESRAWCSKDPATSKYRCVPWPTLGQDCTSSRHCSFGDSYCADDFTCKALPAVGEPCVDVSDCGRDQICDTAVTPFVCRALPQAGEPCTGPCASGLTCQCDADGCVERHCRRLRLGGEACSDPNDVCLPGATRCDNGTCVELGLQGLFESKCGP